jgi:hypothetical protein
MFHLLFLIFTLRPPSDPQLHQMVVRKLERQYLDMCGPNGAKLTIGSGKYICIWICMLYVRFHVPTNNR